MSLRLAVCICTLMFASVSPLQAQTGEALVSSHQMGAVFPERTGRPVHHTVAFYETVLQHRTMGDPRLIFLLANGYIAQGQEDVGIALFERVLERDGDTLSPLTRSTYLAAYGLMRGSRANRVPLLQRPFWVNETIDVLDEANAIVDGQNPLAHWSAGVVFAQLPTLFGRREAAVEHLRWLVDRPETEPLPGFYREAYRYLGEIYGRTGQTQAAAEMTRLAGYENGVPQTLSTGWFATSRGAGLQFAPTPWIETVREDQVWAFQGYGFSTLYAVRGTDGLILIDAGTQPFAVESALADLYDAHPDLPEVSDVLITHAHWDHIGGHTVLRQRFPEARFWGHAGHAQAQGRSMRGHVYEQFRSTFYSHDWIATYAPDVAVDRATTAQIAGLQVELLPTPGGETEDAILIMIRDLDLVFSGDVLMPFFGEPWVEEGSVLGALETLQTLESLPVNDIYHGHYGITVMYPQTTDLVAIRQALSWLEAQSRARLLEGQSAEDIIRANLIPAEMLGHEAAYLPYVASRDAFIRRLADSLTGIWQEESTGLAPKGLDVIGLVERERALSEYFDLDAGETRRAVRRMIEAGDLELALETALAAERAWPRDASFTRLRQEAADRLASLNQFFDPFAFTVFVEIAGREHPAMPAQ